MVKSKDRWSALSMQQRADLIKLYTDNGITNIKEIRKHYNSFATGGPTEDSEQSGIQKVFNKAYDFRRNVINLPRRMVLGEIMEVSRLFKDGVPKAINNIRTKNWDSGSNRWKGDKNYFKNEYEDPAQTAFLFPKREFKDAMLNSGYMEGTPGDYGLVRKAVGKQNIPVYTKQKDAEYVGELKPLFNLDSDFYGQNPIEHSGYFPTAVYSDSEGNIYQKAWDLHDYGTDSQGNSGRKYGLIGTLLSEALDLFGNNIVKTTGLQKLSKEDQERMLNYINKHNTNILYENSTYGNTFALRDKMLNIKKNEYNAYIEELLKEKKTEKDITPEERVQQRQDYPFTKYIQEHHLDVYNDPLFNDVMAEYFENKKYKIGGPIEELEPSSVTDYTISKAEIENAKQFVEDYYMSEAYKQRARNSNLSEKVPLKKTFGVFPRKMVGREDLTTNESYKAFFPVIGLQPSENPIYKDLLDDIGNTAAHEYTHYNKIYNTKRGGDRNYTSPYYGMNYRRVPKEYYDLLQPIIINSSHDWELNENYSDLMGLRYLMQKHGVFDSMDPNAIFNESNYKSLLKDKRYENDRFLKTHTKEQVIKAINDVAFLTDNKNFENLS